MKHMPCVFAVINLHIHYISPDCAVSVSALTEKIHPTFGTGVRMEGRFVTLRAS